MKLSGVNFGCAFTRLNIGAVKTYSDSFIFETFLFRSPTDMSVLGRIVMDGLASFCDEKVSKMKQSLWFTKGFLIKSRFKWNIKSLMAKIFWRFSLRQNDFLFWHFYLFEEGIFFEMRLFWSNWPTLFWSERVQIWLKIKNIIKF